MKKSTWTLTFVDRAIAWNAQEYRGKGEEHETNQSPGRPRCTACGRGLLHFHPRPARPKSGCRSPARPAAAGANAAAEQNLRGNHHEAPGRKIRPCHGQDASG